MKQCLVLILCCSASAAWSHSGDSTGSATSISYELSYYAQLLGTPLDSITNNILYETAEEWIGTPYRYAGDEKSGIDCSGFTAVLYRCAYDIILEGSSADIYKKTDPLKKEELKEGDLVFFKIRDGAVSHVGVYLGGNKFVHASTQAGVIISDLDESYYKKHFYKGGRVNSHQ